MAPPQLFINTKTLQLEKQPEIVNVDGYENNQEREDDKKDEEDSSDASNPSEGTNGKNESRIQAKFPLPILSYILIFTGLAISLPGAFLGINKPAHCYFFVLGLHLLSLGCLHLANAQGIRSFSSLLERWDSCCKQKIASIFVGTVANFIFTALELYTLFNNDFDYDDFDCSYGRDGWMFCYGWPFIILGLIFSIFLALPWPLLLLWTTKKCTIKFIV